MSAVPGVKWNAFGSFNLKVTRKKNVQALTGTIEDVVNACLYIIKDASYMTGSVLRLDGGYVLAGEKVPSMPKGIG